MYVLLEMRVSVGVERKRGLWGRRCRLRREEQQTIEATTRLLVNVNASRTRDLP